LRIALAAPSATPPPICALPLSRAGTRLAGVTWTMCTLSPYFWKMPSVTPTYRSENPAPVAA
jgi:hypothetical protein